MLSYPAWFSALDRAVIDAAYAKAFPPQSFFIGRRTGPLDLSQWFTESVAIQHVLAVAKVVASRLPQPFPEDRRHDLEDLLAQIILCGAKRRASPKSPLQDFEVMVREALSTSASWPARDTLPTPSVPDRLPPGLPALLTLPEARKRFKLSIDTMERMEKDGELEIHRIGKGKSRRVAVTELQRVLELAKYRKYQFPDRDR